MFIVVVAADWIVCATTLAARKRPILLWTGVSSFTSYSDSASSCACIICCKYSSKFSSSWPSSISSSCFTQSPSIAATSSRSTVSLTIRPTAFSLSKLIRSWKTVGKFGLSSLSYLLIDFAACNRLSSVEMRSCSFWSSGCISSYIEVNLFMYLFARIDRSFGEHCWHCNSICSIRWLGIVCFYVMLI